MRTKTLTRRRPLGGVVRAILLGISGAAMAYQAAFADIPEPFQAVRAVIEEQVAGGNAASVAVVVIKGDETLWAEGFGLADRRTGTRATPDTIYRLASISKPITATGLMILVERGRIDLDAPANRYLPGPKLRAPLGQADAMTVRRLANHTSGLPVHYNFFYDGHQPPPMDETIRLYGFASKKPGESGEYSNLGFGILGYITEVVSGVPWRSFMEQEVYDPLGMSRTSDRIRPGFEADAAIPYTLDVAGRFVPVGHYEFDHPGASAIWSSANDLARFARMHLRDGELDGVRILDERHARAMREKTGDRGEGTGVGIGWAITDERGRRCISHSGGMPGVSTMLRLYPDDDAAFVVLLNSDTPAVTREITRRLSEALFPDTETRDEANQAGTPEDSRPAGLPGELIGTWKGRLAHPDGDIPLGLEVQTPTEVRATFGAEPPVRLKDVSMQRGRLVASLEGKLPTRKDFHGPVTIEFGLDPRGDRLTGVGAAIGADHFHLPHWVELARAADTDTPADGAARATGPAYDLIITNGRIVDGCGTPWYRGDLAIRGGKIAAIGRLGEADARRIVDATGLVVAPGFIDMMGQTAAPFLKNPRAGDNLLTQGITTINAGEGDSDAPLAGEAAERAGWTTMAEFFQALDRTGMPINAVQTVGHTQVRRLVLGETDREATPEELKRMEELVREGMEAGAIGLSTSLIYPPAVYAPTGEIVALARVAGEHGGAYYTHMRNEGDRLLEAIDEALAIGQQAGVPVHIFHLKAAGRANWPKMDLALARIKAARAGGQQVDADIYPYLNNGLGIDSFIHPRHSAEGRAGLLRRIEDPDRRAEIRREMEGEDPWENWYRHIGRDWDNVVLGGMTAEPYKGRDGRSLGEIARSLNKDPWDVFFDVVRSGAFALPRSMSEANKIKAMRQEFISFDTDVGPAGGSSIATHPRAYGSFPRVLSRYVRELGVLSLEQAVARMTSVAANAVGLHDRGRLAEGLAADIVVFDPEQIRDRATLAEPGQTSEGVRFVIVNGQLVLDDSAPTAALPGRVLRGPGYRGDRKD